MRSAVRVILRSVWQAVQQMYLLAECTVHLACLAPGGDPAEHTLQIVRTSKNIMDFILVTASDKWSLSAQLGLLPARAGQREHLKFAHEVG
jgi:hypothetical protein